MGCAERYLRGAGADLRYVGDFVYRAADRRPGEFRIALFLTELAPGWLKRPLGIAIEAAGSHSKYRLRQMVGLFYLCAAVRRLLPGAGRQYHHRYPHRSARSGPAFGIGILAAGVILAIMIIPYIAAVMRDVFEQTPVMMKESAYGIGCTTWEVIWRIVLPFTKNGVIGGINAGLGRAVGETMAVTFIIGNTYQLDSASLYMPGATVSPLRWRTNLPKRNPVFTLPH